MCASGTIFFKKVKSHWEPMFKTDYNYILVSSKDL